MIKKVVVALLVFCLYINNTMADGDEHGEQLKQLKQLQKESAIPVWQFSIHQIKTYYESMQESLVLQKWRLLNDWLIQHPQVAPIAIVTSPKDDIELGIYASWLRWQILVNNADGRYSYAYVFLLSQLHSQQDDYSEEMLTFFAHARFALQIDELRCANPKNSGFFSKEFEALEQMQMVLSMLDNLSADQKKRLQLNVQTIEEVRGERQPMAWLCAKMLKKQRFIDAKLWQKKRSELMESVLLNAL
jgi:hypothetical protein